MKSAPQYGTIPTVLFLLISLGWSPIVFGGAYEWGGLGSRAQAMGGAYIGAADDWTAMYWNPAGLTRAHGLQVQFMHAKQFFTSIQYDYLGISNRLENGAGLADVSARCNAEAADQAGTEIA